MIPFIRALYLARRQLWRLSRPTTLGVRVIATTPEGGVVLVRHAYVAGWHLPGGGVERGESFMRGAARELEEEGGYFTREEDLRCFGVYANIDEFKSDHVILVVTEKITPSLRTASRFEIVESRLFPLQSLPTDLAAGSARRLDEYLGRETIRATW